MDDIRIKGDRDGIQTAEILRRDFDIPVVYLTAYADADTITRAKQTSPHGYLIKPVKPEELHSTVEIALHRHEMERRLRERERWFSTTLRSIGDAVIATDPAGRVTFVNENAELLINARAESLIGKDVATAVRLVDERTSAAIENPIARALREGKVGGTVPAALQTQTGERSIDDTTTPIVDGDGKVLGAVLVFRDVTAHRQAQNQLVLADRLSSLGTMAAGVAHEINNPLAVIVANGALASPRRSPISKESLATATPRRHHERARRDRGDGRGHPAQRRAPPGEESSATSARSRARTRRARAPSTCATRSSGRCASPRRSCARAARSCARSRRCPRCSPPRRGSGRSSST